MIAFHKHFRLYNRHQARFLTQRGVAGQRLRIGLDAAPAWNSGADRNHRTPLGKTGTHLKILFQAVAQSVQTFGDFLSGMSSQVLCARVDLYARNDSGVDDGFDKGSAIFLPLADRLVVEDCATNALPEVRRADD